MSDYLRSVEYFNGPALHVLPNGLRSDFSCDPKINTRVKFEDRTILFVGSLKEYKAGDLELHVKKNDKMKTGTLNANVYVVENFENLYNNVIQHLEENNYNEYNEYNELYQKKLINNDFISETYYVLLIIFLLFLVYKIGNKK